MIALCGCELQTLAVNRKIRFLTHKGVSQNGASPLARRTRFRVKVTAFSCCVSLQTLVAIVRIMCRVADVGAPAKCEKHRGCWPYVCWYERKRKQVVRQPHAHLVHEHAWHGCANISRGGATQSHRGCVAKCTQQGYISQRFEDDGAAAGPWPRAVKQAIHRRHEYG